MTEVPSTAFGLTFGQILTKKIIAKMKLSSDFSYFSDERYYTEPPETDSYIDAFVYVSAIPSTTMRLAFGRLLWAVYDVTVAFSLHSFKKPKMSNYDEETINTQLDYYQEKLEKLINDNIPTHWNLENVASACINSEIRYERLPTDESGHLYWLGKSTFQTQQIDDVGKGGVQVTVTDQATGLPIEGATCTLTDSEGTQLWQDDTNASGIASSGDTIIGQNGCTLTVTKSGYTDETVSDIGISKGVTTSQSVQMS